MTGRTDMLMNIERIDDAAEKAVLDTKGKFPPDRIVRRGLGALRAAQDGRRDLANVIGALKGSTDTTGRTDRDLTGRAMRAAAVAHAKQVRKEGGVPYIAHPLAGALHLAWSGYHRDCLAAALVHDVIEDTDWNETRLAKALGAESDRCLALVRFATEMPKDVSWHDRKAAVVAKLVGADRDARALVIADKGHNLRSLLHALRQRGNAAWAVLRHGQSEQSWFTHALARAVRDEPGEPFASFRATVAGAVHAGWLNAPANSENIG